MPPRPLMENEMSVGMWKDIMVREEMLMGHIIIRDAPWLNLGDWADIIVSEDKKGRIRLVLLAAKRPGEGAFGRLIAALERAEKKFCVVEPLNGLLEWCKKHGWKERVMGQGNQRHHVWYPR